ncbi:MAG: hypothetical protein ABI811_23290 [Acidobacteriota bacterium]
MTVSEEPSFYLYWLRETGCDAGTPIGAGDIPASIRERILTLAKSDSLAASPATFHLRLPFFDRREERQQDQLLPAFTYERTGDLIRPLLSAAAATRDMAATCALAEPFWRGAPPDRDLEYFPTWQRVSIALQRWLRVQVAATYFDNPAAFEDRAAAYPLIAYQAARPFFGRPRSEFTYDLRDYPSSDDTLSASWKLVGRSMQRILVNIEDRLTVQGNPRLAHHYSPVWHQDVLVAVQRRPKRYAELLSREAAIINAVIDLGTQPKVDTINRSAKIISQQLRKMHGRDMRSLGCGLFEEATRALARQRAGGFDDVLDSWLPENSDMPAARSPDLRIGI